MKQTTTFILVLLIATIFNSCKKSQEAYDFSERAPITEEELDPFWLGERMQNQLAEAKNYEVEHGFRFEDKISSSQIKFIHTATNEAGKDFRGNHYDHGNGICIADVDKDGLQDIYFVSQIGQNELWRNLGGGQFEDITASSGLLIRSVGSGVTASFVDIDNDGDPDLYATFVKTGNRLFENDGTGKFTDISSVSGIDYEGHSSGATFFDYNRDGLLDLFLSNVGVYTTDETAIMQVDGKNYSYYRGFTDAFAGHLKPERTEQSFLYKNNGDNTFTDVSELTGLVDTSWTGDAFPLDVNQDGWQDLYVLNMQGHDEYYENQQGESFVKKSRAVFPKTSWGAMSAKQFDWNNDGMLDIYVTDMHSDMSQRVAPEKELLKSEMKWPESFVRSEGQSIYGNSFFQAQAGESYTEVSDAIGLENFWPWGLSTGDVNADGFEDIFVVCSMNYPFRYTPNMVMLNNAGKNFLASEYILGVEPRKDSLYAQPWYTLDCDGVDAGHRECKDQSGEVEVWSSRGSRSSVIFDMDNDGDLDIITNEFNNYPMVLQNDLSDRKPNLKYLKIQLEGTTSNKDGLGAVVRVYTKDKTQTKMMDGKSGYMSQSSYPLYFGLDEATAVDKIEVRWPTGIPQTFEGPFELNSLLVLTEK